jgi:hypothetical protein
MPRIFIARTICRRAVSIIWPELHCKREFVRRGLSAILLKRDAARRWPPCGKRHGGGVSDRLCKSLERTGREIEVSSSFVMGDMMSTKASVSNTSATMAGNGFHSRAFDKRDVRETHSVRVWREELAEMLEANLRHVDALRGLRRSTDAFTATALRRL